MPCRGWCLFHGDTWRHGRDSRKLSRCGKAAPGMSRWCLFSKSLYGTEPLGHHPRQFRLRPTTMRDTMSNNAPLVLALGGLLIGFAVRRGRVPHQLLRHGLAVRHLQLRRLPPLSRVGAGGGHGAGRRARCCRRPASSRSTSRCTSPPSFNWLGHILAGGLIFGIGMVFAGGCPSRNLARAGGGDLRALFTLIVLGLCRLHDDRRPRRAGPRGPGAGDSPCRAAPAPTQGLGDFIGRARAAARGCANLIVAAADCRHRLAYCFWRRALSRLAGAHPVRHRRRPGRGRRLGADRPGLRRDRPRGRRRRSRSPTCGRWATRCNGWRSTPQADAGLRRGERVRRAARRLRGGGGHGPLPPRRPSPTPPTRCATCWAPR